MILIMLQAKDMPQSSQLSQLPELWNHQNKAIAVAKDRFLLRFDTGTGKTRTAIELFKRKNKNLDKVLIFAPLNVCRNWMKEFEQYFPFPVRLMLIAGQSKAYKMRVLSDFADYELTDRPIIAICNIEILRSKEYRKILNRSGAKFCIIDECHNLKTPIALQSRGFFELDKKLKFENVYMLSATPTPGGYLDLYYILFITGRTDDSFYIWRRKNFFDKNERRRGTRNYYYWPDYEVTQSAKLDFDRILADISMSANKNEALDLPPFVRTNVFCGLSKTRKTL
jgi:Superfamily II DNA/RNA helicases, SNF2 family